jgi:hypothetical protein
MMVINFTRAVVQIARMSLANKSWGDEEFEEDLKDHETQVDENGIKYSYTFKVNEDGKKVRVTKTIRVSKTVKKVNKRVEERRQRWKKFGKVAGVEGIEPGATYRGDDVYLVFGEHEKVCHCVSVIGCIYSYRLVGTRAPRAREEGQEGA